MGIFRLVKNEEGNVRKHDDSYCIKNYLTKDFNKDFSLAVSELDGKLELTKSVASDRIYYFIEGNANFNLDGNQIKISSEDVLFIGKNTPYSSEGNFKAVLINIPAFSIENERKGKEI